MALPFFEHEDREILRLRDLGWSFMQIAVELGRSVDPVAKRYHKLRPGDEGRRVSDYSPEEDAILIAHADKPLSAFVHLLPNRKPKGIYERFKKLGISRAKFSGIAINPGGNRAYTPEEDEKIRTMKAAGATIVAIAAELGRSKKSVEARRHKLKLDDQPKPATNEPVERPLGVPFTTSSGIRAIRLGSGVVPYVACLYSHLHE